MSALGLQVLTRRPSAGLANGELTYLGRQAIDLDLAVRQHAAYRAAIASTGATLIDAPADEAFPDSTFVEDAVLAFPECLVLTRPGAASRRDEPERLRPYLPDDRPLFRLDGSATLDGGDVLRIGRTLFVGLSTRTNVAAIDGLREIMGPHGYAVAAVRVTGALHLKTAVTAPADDLLLANPEWVDLSAFGDRRALAVAPDEPFAANCLRIGERLFLQTSHGGTAARLQAAGLDVEGLDISEFAKLEAGLTCMSVVIGAAAD